MTIGPAVRAVGFLAVLAAVFAAAVGVGQAVGPVGDDAAGRSDPATTPEPADGHGDAPDHGTDGATNHGDDGHGAAAPGADENAPVVGGLAASDNGFTLALDTPSLPAGRSELRFRVIGGDGAAVTDYDVEHEKLLHLIVVRRDLSGFQHVHPELAADGTWSVPLRLEPGPWRVVADFVPSDVGKKTTLAVDLSVPGSYQAGALPAHATTAEVDGYQVTMNGALLLGREGTLTFTVANDGQPVEDLEPYLAANGHLVAIRSSDLGYLHVHPLGDPGDVGSSVTFAATAPSTGQYRLFLDFKHAGSVHTAEFTVDVENL